MRFFFHYAVRDKIALSQGQDLRVAYWPSRAGYVDFTKPGDVATIRAGVLDLDPTWKIAFDSNAIRWENKGNKRRFLFWHSGLVNQDMLG